MDMELFRHNHARYISTSVVDPGFLGQQASVFNYSAFIEHIRRKWKEEMGNSKNLRIVSFTEWDTAILAKFSIL